VPVALQLPRGRRLKPVAIAVGVAVLTIAPWSLRNSTTFDRPLLVSTEDGPVIAGANCSPTYHGSDLGYWRSDCLPRAHDRNFADRAHRLRGVGLDYAREHAGRLPVVEGVRLLRTFGIWQPVRHVYFAEGRMMPGRSIAVVACWLVMALGAAGAVAMRRRRGPLAILLAPFMLTLATTLIAFGYPRFRYATDVVLIVLAAVALERLGHRAASATAEMQPRVRN
jgi:hypothetical protein